MRDFEDIGLRRACRRAKVCLDVLVTDPKNKFPDSAASYLVGKALRRKFLIARIASVCDLSGTVSSLIFRMSSLALALNCATRAVSSVGDPRTFAAFRATSFAASIRGLTSTGGHLSRRMASVTLSHSSPNSFSVNSRRPGIWTGWAFRQSCRSLVSLNWRHGFGTSGSYPCAVFACG